MIEFERNGYMYDAFEVYNENGVVRLLVKKDNLDTALSNVLKQSKRMLRKGAVMAKAQLFNIYFTQGFQPPVWTQS